MQPALIVREAVFSVTPERTEDLLAILAVEIIALYQSFPSYRGAFVFGDRAKGFVASLTSWSSHEHHTPVQLRDLVAYVRNHHHIPVELQSVKEWDYLYEDRFVPEGPGSVT